MLTGMRRFLITSALALACAIPSLAQATATSQPTPPAVKTKEIPAAKQIKLLKMHDELMQATSDFQGKAAAADAARTAVQAKQAAFAQYSDQVKKEESCADFDISGDDLKCVIPAKPEKATNSEKTPASVKPPNPGK